MLMTKARLDSVDDVDRASSNRFLVRALKQR